MKLATALLSLLTLAAPVSAQIQHIVVIFKENRSFDNYFGTYPGVNGATSGKTSTGISVPLLPGTDVDANCGHLWQSAHVDINGGKMDGFSKTCAKLKAYITYGRGSVINAYWQYAHDYALADNMFATVAGPSFPTHAQIFAGTSNHATDNPAAPGLNLSLIKYGWGCDAAAKGALVRSIDPLTLASYKQPPCFTVRTMAEVLNASAVSWRVYAPQPGTNVGYIWNFVSYFSQLWNGPDRANSVQFTQFVQDAQNCKLPAVSWVIPSMALSEHAPHPVSNGVAWTVQQINAVMTSPCGYWGNTAIILTWDDWGGYYDHVAPPVPDAYGYGIRVPLLMIAANAKPGYVSHSLYTYDSINAFIEHTFATGCLLKDCDFLTNDLTDMLDLSPAAQALAPRRATAPKVVKVGATVSLQKDEQLGREVDDDDN